MTDKAEDLRRYREELVRHHIDAEMAGDADAVVATFAYPKYTLVATGVVLDGADQVAERVHELANAMPGAKMQLLSLRHSEDAVTVETLTTGHHDGPLLGVEPTGRSYTTQGVAIFRFEGRGLVEEIVYYDRLTLLEQLTGEGS